MLLAQTATELRLLMRNGEQVLLTLVIPVLLLVVFSTVPIVDLGGRRVDFVVPGVLALSVMSTAFTGQAIATGFERRYGVLKRLGATPLPRSLLMLAKTGGVLGVEVVQVGVVAGVGYALGWHPHGNPAWVLLLLVLGTAAFSGLGLLMAGTLRAEATLAAANLVYLVLLVLGGMVFPLDRFPSGVAAVCERLPAAALAQGMRHVLQAGGSAPVADLFTLGAWAVGALAAAAATFRWE
jgi:ABC-2 type transport system permease protein